MRIAPSLLPGDLVATSPVFAPSVSVKEVLTKPIQLYPSSDYSTFQAFVMLADSVKAELRVAYGSWYIYEYPGNYTENDTVTDRPLIECNGLTYTYPAFKVLPNGNQILQCVFSTVEKAEEYKKRKNDSLNGYAYIYATVVTDNEEFGNVIW